MASPYFAALQSGGIVGDTSRQRGRAGMLAQRARPRPAPMATNPIAPVGGGGGFMAPMAAKLRSFAAPSAPVGPAIGAMPAGPEVMGPTPGFQVAAPQMQGSFLRAMGGGGGGAAPSVFNRLAGGGFTGRTIGAAPEMMGGAPAIQQQPAAARALRSFGGGFGRMMGGGFQ